MHILYVVPSVSPGGIENLVLSYGAHFLSKGYEVDILAFQKGEENIFSSFSNIYYISEISLVKRYLLIRKFFQTHRHYDVVHSNVHYNNGLIARFASKYGVRNIVSHVHTNGGKCRNFLSQLYNNIVYGLLRAMILKYSNHCVACSMKSGELMYGKGNEFVFIPNGIRTNSFRFNDAIRKDVRRKLKVSDDEILFLHVGRISQEKNHPFLLRFFDSYHKEHKNSKLVLVGDGPLRDWCLEFSEAHGLSDSVIFEGFQKNISGYYFAADIFLLPSFFEGFPVSLVEAQTSGVLSIVSQNIPDETIITDRVRVATIEEGEVVWCQAVSLSEKGINRESYSEIVYNKGFDTANVCKLLSDLYNG